MITDIEHLESIIRHIKIVQDAGIRLGLKLFKNGEEKLGILIVAYCMRHDNSKFFTDEFKYLRTGLEITADFEKALSHHHIHNQHHPEWWRFEKGIDSMPDECLAEMVCDWYARSCEQGTDFRKWIEKECTYKYPMKTETLEKIKHFAYLILEPELLEK